MKKIWLDIVLAVAALAMLVFICFTVTAPAADEDRLASYVTAAGDDFSFMFD